MKIFQKLWAKPEPANPFPKNSPAPKPAKPAPKPEPKPAKAAAGVDWSAFTDADLKGALSELGKRGAKKRWSAKKIVPTPELNLPKP